MIYLLSLNWNTAKLMNQMVDSANKFKDKDFELIIVDNGSKDVENLKTKPTVSLPVNVGFAAGNNVGLRKIEEKNPDDNDIVVFINSDIEITEQGWDLKFKNILSTSTIGVVGSSYHPIFWTNDGKFQIQPIPSIPVKSDGIQGAFFGIRWGILNLIKENEMWFDEEFKFAQYEDQDICIRIIKSGHSCLWMPCSHHHHHHQLATKSNGYKLSNDIKNIIDFKANAEKNRLRLLQKHRDFFIK